MNAPIEVAQFGYPCLGPPKLNWGILATIERHGLEAKRAFGNRGPKGLVEVPRGGVGQRPRVKAISDRGPPGFDRYCGRAHPMIRECNSHCPSEGGRVTSMPEFRRDPLSGSWVVIAGG